MCSGNAQMPGRVESNRPVVCVFLHLQELSSHSSWRCKRARQRANTTKEQQQQSASLKKQLTPSRSALPPIRLLSPPSAVSEVFLSPCVNFPCFLSVPLLCSLHPLLFTSVSPLSFLPAIPLCVRGLWGACYPAPTHTSPGWRDTPDTRQMEDR